MKIHILVLLAIFMTGCCDCSKCDPKGKETQVKSPSGEVIENIEIVKIRGCQYILNKTTGEFKVYTHLGDCPNHIYN